LILDLLRYTTQRGVSVLFSLRFAATSVCLGVLFDTGIFNCFGLLAISCVNYNKLNTK